MSFFKPYEGETSADGRRVRSRIDAGTRSLYFWGGIFVLLAIGITAFLNDTDFYRNTEILVYVLPAVVVSLFAIYKGALHPYKWSLTSDAQRHKEEGDRRSIEREERITAAITKVLSIWYVRYGLAVLIAWFLFDAVITDKDFDGRTENWAGVIVGAAVVLWLARELAVGVWRLVH